MLLIITPFVGAIPGPGGVFVGLGGAFLLASEVRRAAHLMDRIENVTIPRLKRLHARLRGGPKPEWVVEDPELWADWCAKTGVTLHANEPAAPVDGGAAGGAATRHDAAVAADEPAAESAPH